MVGYNPLIVVSGIDGSFDEFDNLLASSLKPSSTLRYAYDRSKSFVENISCLRKTISMMDEEHLTILGWSIGAVASAFISDMPCIKACIMINPFYNRREILEPRGIFCDEDVILSDAPQNVSKKIILNGARDDKIPMAQTTKVTEYYAKEGKPIHVIFPGAAHSLSSFPQKELVEIINKYSEYENDDNRC